VLKHESRALFSRSDVEKIRDIAARALFQVFEQLFEGWI